MQVSEVSEVSNVHPQEHTFANPPMLYSRDGHLHVDLAAAPATCTIAGHQFQGMLYNGVPSTRGVRVLGWNGQYMPPVWRLRPGDKLTVTLHNHLAEETNLHFHGLGVSPLKNGDNVFVHIRPGETFNYEIACASM
jgi:suppressor of ftsI